MIQLRLPNINGKTPEERQAQMERYIRSMVEQLNFALQKDNKKEDTSEKNNTAGTINVQGIVNEKLKKYLATIYPVGSVYISVSETDPKELFGGTWERIKDRFLLSAGDTYKAGSTGGEATHKLTVNEMPSHTHKAYQVANATISAGTGKNILFAGENWAQGTIATQATGGGSAHNNMPPYITVNVWKRIS